MSADACPPLYVPTLAECEDALHEARQTMMDRVTPGRWDFDNMKCGHSSHRTPATAGEWADEARAAIVKCRATTRDVDTAAHFGGATSAAHAADDAAIHRAVDAVAALERLATAASAACLATRTRGHGGACMRTAGHTGRHHDGTAAW